VLGRRTEVGGCSSFGGDEAGCASYVGAMGTPSCYYWAENDFCLDGCGTEGFMNPNKDDCFACSFEVMGVEGATCPGECATHAYGYCGMPCSDTAGDPNQPFRCYFCDNDACGQLAGCDWNVKEDDEEECR